LFIALGYVEDKLSFEVLTLNKKFNLKLGKFNSEENVIEVSRLGRMVI
jgi:hypothetical protein